MENQKLELLKRGLRMIGYSFSNKVLDTILNVYKVVDLKLSATDLRDLSIIEHDMNVRYTEEIEKEKEDV